MTDAIERSTEEAGQHEVVPVVESRSVLRRKAIQEGEPVPEFTADAATAVEGDEASEKRVVDIVKTLAEVAGSESEEIVVKPRAKVVRRGFSKTRGRAAASVPSKRGFQVLICKECKTNEEKCDANASAVTCSTCVQKTVAPPPRPLTKEEREARAAEKAKEFFAKNAKPAKNAAAWPERAKTWPKAWWLKKEFVDPENGDVYHKGVKAGNEPVADALTPEQDAAVRSLPSEDEQMAEAKE